MVQLNHTCGDIITSCCCEWFAAIPSISRGPPSCLTHPSCTVTNVGMSLSYVAVIAGHRAVIPPPPLDIHSASNASRCRSCSFCILALRHAMYREQKSLHSSFTFSSSSKCIRNVCIARSIYAQQSNHSQNKSYYTRQQKQ